MRLANHNGRAVLIIGDRITDIHQASADRFGPDLMEIYQSWNDFKEWAGSVIEGTEPLDESALGNPIPRPRQVFGIGLNYQSHAEESGMDIPSVPATFTKFPASLTGPFDDVEVVGPAVDWEAELVAVIGTPADRVDEADGWDHIAGLAVGQDISDRMLQFAAGSQFSLGKSRRGYGPIGPSLVTPDEFDDPDDLTLGCSVNGVTKQESSTSDLIFSIPRLVAELSAILPLWPGDVIFTGTPAGIGATRQPAEFLAVGDVLETWVDGIGTIRNRFVDAVTDQKTS